MKNKILTALTLITFTFNVAYADPYFNEKSYYTGETYFTSPAYIEKTDVQNSDEPLHYEDGSRNNEAKNGTIPPVRRIREAIQKKSAENQAKRTELAPVMPDNSIYNSDTETSDFASKEQKEEFDENMMPDGFEADEQSVEDNKKAKHFFKNKADKNKAKASEENTENIILDCDNMDYDTENYCLYATGNVNVKFVKQETTVKADKITYDRMNNTIKAEGNVVIIKNGQNIYGDYIFVDMNEENALIENPITSDAVIEIKAKKGYVYGDKIVQEEGSIDVEHSFPIKFRPSGGGPQILSKMIVPKEQTLANDMEQGLIKVKAKELTIKQKGDLEVIAIKHADVKKGKYTLLKIPAIKIYTNKNHDYAETNFWELGSYRDLGTYIGPGFVFELPKGSVLKAIPILNYDHRIGVGAIGRFSSGTNQTQAAYGTADSRILVRGIQKLDDHLFLEYAMNDYMDDWFLGRRRPKYGVTLRYENDYSSNGFLLKDRLSIYKHKLDFGYYQDMDRDKHYRKLHSSNIGTTRLRYMGQATQNLYKYRNIEKQTAFDFNIVGAIAASVYGTGDTQVIGRIGPNIHTQYRRWMQDIGYYQSVYSDNTPLPVYDAYRYGKGNFYLREYFRINKYLTLSWFSSMNFTNDSPSNDIFQENAFWISIGPDDVKFNIGYDVIRQNTFFTVEMMTDAKGTHIDYDKLVIKRDKKPSEEAKESGTTKKSNFKNSEKAPVLQHAVVEEIKVEEDVL